MRVNILSVACLFVMVYGTMLSATTAQETTAQAAPAKSHKATAKQPEKNAAQPQAADAQTSASPAAAGAPDPAQAEAAPASSEPEHPKHIVWPFAGMKGYVDKQAAQRGFQIYSQVCSACHSMNLVAYRSLGSLGFSEPEIKALASQKQVEDFDDKGQRVERPASPSDHIVAPFANEAAARTANGGAYPPDLSLIIKARHEGADYVYSILTGFGPPPGNEPAVTGKYYNPYFPGHWISMPQPLHDNAVTYQDGTPANVDQMARDVVVFLQWAAEPEMEQRHAMGFKVFIFLSVLAVFCYVAKKRIWRNIEK